MANGYPKNLHKRMVVMVEEVEHSKEVELMLEFVDTAHEELATSRWAQPVAEVRARCEIDGWDGGGRNHRSSTQRRRLSPGRPYRDQALSRRICGHGTVRTLEDQTQLPRRRRSRLGTAVTTARRSRGHKSTTVGVPRERGRPSCSPAQPGTHARKLY